ncbi:sulfotransferase 1E1 [Nephila pilipes]|uniref:Sulfotransferase 1E1 n=1 Tax=Nephila pilipes TaxID=299642 RepID=A0A8X6UDZ1_NEPPI|nr:sulfotransferase 1E1 [Nephila pilipes]
MKVAPFIVPEVHRAAMEFKPGKDDVIVAAYPKCGCTFTLQIVSLILRKGKPLMTYDKYFSYLPFLERTMMDEISQMPKPRCIKTHFPFQYLKFSPEAKYIYVTRHPADCLVSYYHHTRLFPTYSFTNGTLDEFFELFLQSEVTYNDFFDHLLAAYKYRNEPNVLIITYESMVADRRAACLKIARFLGEEYYQNLMENNGEVLDKVVEYSSLEFMKSTVNAFWTKRFCGVPSIEEQESNPVMKKLAELLRKAEKEGERSKGEFIRKGRVGGAQQVLSPEQKERLNQYILEKTANSDVMKLWEKN